MRGGELLINTMLKAKMIEVIPELGLILTMNGFQAVVMFIIQHQD
jgi:hypothetical protein